MLLAAALLGLLVVAGLNLRRLPAAASATARQAPNPARLLRRFGANRAVNWMGIINAAARA